MLACISHPNRPYTLPVANINDFLYLIFLFLHYEQVLFEYIL